MANPQIQLIHQYNYSLICIDLTFWYCGKSSLKVVFVLYWFFKAFAKLNQYSFHYFYKSEHLDNYVKFFINNWFVGVCSFFGYYIGICGYLYVNMRFFVLLAIVLAVASRLAFTLEVLTICQSNIYIRSRQ